MPDPKQSPYSRAAAREIVELFNIHKDDPAGKIVAEDEIVAVIEKHRQKKSAPMTDYGRLVDLWMARYKEFFGSPSAFLPRDGKGAKTLLSTGMTPEQIMGIAVMAWRFRDSKRHWNCKFSVTLCGLCSRFNEIRSELGAAALNVDKERKF